MTTVLVGESTINPESRSGVLLPAGIRLSSQLTWGAVSNGVGNWVQFGESGLAKSSQAKADNSAARDDSAEDRPATPHVDAPALDGLARTILEVGRIHFVRFGFQKTSVANIAEDAKTSVGLIYYHFTNKEGLYRAVWNDYQNRQWRRAHEAIKLVRSAGVTDGRLLFLAGTQTYVSNCWENRDIVRLFYDLDAPPGFIADSRTVMHEWLNMNARLLETGRGPRSKHDRATMVLVEMASSAIGGASRAVASCATREEADEVVELAMAVFANMIEHATGTPEANPLNPTPKALTS